MVRQLLEDPNFTIDDEDEGGGDGSQDLSNQEYNADD